MNRIEPAAPPYEPAIAEALARIMPTGMEPLVLFRTMARNPRIFGKMFAGGLLDKGSLSLRQREIVLTLPNSFHSTHKSAFALRPSQTFSLLV